MFLELYSMFHALNLYAHVLCEQVYAIKSNKICFTAINPGSLQYDSATCVELMPRGLNSCVIVAVYF